ncbi:MAG: T9SS type A sorting domain-containing protein, partial [Bacteroidales bacterium]|nr:T9SS type A sorting domain-containing protein [Bacteroidales bacterium]
KNGLIYYCSNEYFSSFKVFTSEQKLHIVDMSTYLNYYLNDSITNIFEVNYKNNINVFPNPARDYIIVKTENTENEKNYFISDMEGKIVLSGLLQSDSSSINVRKLKKGTYFLKIGPDIIYKWVKE